MSPTDHSSLLSAEPVELVSTTVWATGQSAPAVQRRGRYVAESTAHPAKMLPAVAAHAIAHYTRPGDWVLDPMCGIGTTLVEALHTGRPALGVEYEPHWVDVTRANIDHTHHLLRARPGASSADAASGVEHRRAHLSVGDQRSDRGCGSRTDSSWRAWPRSGRHAAQPVPLPASGSSQAQTGLISGAGWHT